MSVTTEVQPRLNPAGYFTLGVLSDLLATVATQPLDTLKTYVMSGRGIPPFRRLWNGTAANCSGVFMQGGLPFLVNGALVRYASNGKTPLSDRERIVLAVSTGLATSTIIAPFERVAKIHQLTGGTVFDAVRRATQNGYGGLIKALGPIALRDAMVFGTFFGGRKVVENHLEDQIPNPQLRASIASVVTGALAGLSSTPADRISVLMQGDIREIYPTMIRTIKTVVATEGVRSLFKGFCTRTVFLATYMFALGVGEKSFTPRLPACFYDRI
jgi:hypothetical protein